MSASVTTARSATSRSTVVQSTIAQSTVVQSTIPQSTVAQSTVAQSTIAQSTIAQSTIAQSTIAQSTTSPSSTTRRPRTTTTSATFIPTVTPYDASSERHADTQRTNKILIGIFTAFGAIFLGLVAFQLLRCYKRRRKSNSTPLPPPREVTMSELGYRHSRVVSMYKDPSAEFSRTPSMIMRHGSGSGLVDTPSVPSNGPSMEKLRVDEPVRRSNDPMRSISQLPRGDSPDHSLADSTIVPTDEETGRRLSALGSRSQSPSNLSLPRPPSQAQIHLRPESRAQYPRPNSVASTSRQSYLAPSWQQRNSIHGSLRRTSYYASGNHGAPHTVHARDRVGLVMPEPLAPELFNYALSGRHDMGLDFTQGRWGSHGNLANEQNPNQSLAPPRRVRTDSWVGQSHMPSPTDSASASDALMLPVKGGTLPRGRSARPEIPQP